MSTLTRAGSSAAVAKFVPRTTEEPWRNSIGPLMPVAWRSHNGNLENHQARQTRYHHRYQSQEQTRSTLLCHCHFGQWQNS